MAVPYLPGDVGGNLQITCSSKSLSCTGLLKNFKVISCCYKMKHWFQARCETVDEGTDCFICSHSILMDPGGSQRLGSLLTAEPMLVSTYLNQKQVCTANRYTRGADQVCPFNAEGWTGRKLCCLEAWCNNFVSLEYAASAPHCPRSSRIPQRTPDHPLIQLRSLDHDLPSHTGEYIMGKKLQTSNLQSQEVKLLPI